VVVRVPILKHRRCLVHNTLVRIIDVREVFTMLLRSLALRDLTSSDPPEMFARAPEALARAEPLAAKLAVERGLAVRVKRWPTGGMWVGVGEDADAPVPLVSLDLKVYLAEDPAAESSVN
jgi:hypothetical protein